MATTTNEIAPSVQSREGAIARWSSLDEFSELWRRMENLFSRSAGYTPLSRLIPTEPFNFEPLVDIFEKEDHVELLAAVPGFSPQDIKVEATPEAVLIQGERKSLHEEKAVPHRQRWASCAASFSVSFKMPAEIDPSNVKATLRDGILRLQVPKSPKAMATTIPVTVQKG